MLEVRPSAQISKPTTQTQSPDHAIPCRIVSNCRAKERALQLAELGPC